MLFTSTDSCPGCLPANMGRLTHIIHSHHAHLEDRQICTFVATSELFTFTGCIVFAEPLMTSLRI